MISDIVLVALTLEGAFIGHTQMIQASLHSTGFDWFIWLVLLIAAWWVLLARTTALLKVLALPTIAISTYFVLFIAYYTVLSM